jgi:hypothetical protein
LAEGWNEGLSEGYIEGLNWAPILNGMLNGTLSVWNPDTSFGTLTFGGTNLSGSWGCCSSGSAGSLTITNWSGPTDWEKYYYGIGYDDGREIGLLDGDVAGYDVAYPRAYATAFRIGRATGIRAGGTEGFGDGQEEGLDDGWDTGYSPGFNTGFVAGLQDLPWPSNLLKRVNYPGRPGAGSIAAADFSVPEPTSLALSVLGLALTRVIRRSRS